MRIAFLADPLDRQYGGIHIYTKELLKALSRIDKENEYFIFRSEAKEEFHGMNEIVVPYSRIPGYPIWRLFFQLPNIIKKMEIDLVIEPAHFGPFNLPKRIKRVTVIHDLTMYLFPQYHLFFSQFIQRIFLPRVLRKSDHIITNSKNTMQDLIRFFPHTKGKSTAILLGKDEIFRRKIDETVLSKHGINKPYILYVGTLEPRKNVIVLINAFNKFKKESGFTHQLVLVGKEGWKSEPILETIRHSPYTEEIARLGYVERTELPVLYSMAELFVYPSIYEGFGLPILEAMACGTTVLTSNVSSLPEVGKNAVLYFSPNSEKELSELLISSSKKKEIRNKYSELGKHQAAKFTWGKTAIHFKKTIENII